MPETTSKPNPDVHPMKIRFSIWDRDNAIEVTTQDDIVIGRVDTDEDITVDLSEHHGRLLGVSRRHAMVFLTHTGVGIRDLHSANGTSCNGVELQPEQAYELQHGDEIKVGGLYITVYFSD